MQHLDVQATFRQRGRPCSEARSTVLLDPVAFELSRWRIETLEHSLPMKSPNHRLVIVDDLLRISLWRDSKLLRSRPQPIRNCRPVPPTL